MIKRIVKLTFKKAAVDEFVELFHQTKRQTRAFEGCRRLELVRSVEQPNVFFLVSHWKSAEAFEKYRQSELFQETWREMKALFKKKVKSWNLETVAEMP